MSKPNMALADVQLLEKIAKLLAFKTAILHAYDEHPNQMDAAAADHDFAKEIARIVEIYQAPNKTLFFNPVEIVTEP